MDLKIKKLTDNLSVPTPAYATAGSSGLDLCAAITTAVLIRGGDSVKVPTGYAVEIPDGFEGQVRARSGLAATDKIGLTNGIGTIDSDYRGEIGVLLTHFGDASMTRWIMPGERIAQLVIVPVAKVVPVLVDELDPTDRGAGGFGSTGTTATAAQVDAAAQAAAPVVAPTPEAPPAPSPAPDTATGETGEGSDSAGAADGATGSASETNAQSQGSTGSQSEQPSGDDLSTGDGGKTITLYDTVNKVLFTGAVEKETNTVVAVSDAEADEYVAAGATDHRAK